MIRRFALTVLAMFLLLDAPPAAAAFDPVKASAELQAMISRSESLNAQGQSTLLTLQAAWAAGSTDPAAVYEELQADLFAIPTLTDVQKEKLKTVFAKLDAGQIDYSQARSQATRIVNRAGYTRDDIQILINFILMVIADAGSGQAAAG